MDKVVYRGITYDARHGGPFDRGSADSYYGRPEEPHLYISDTAMSPRISESQMSDAEIADYMAGYSYNEESGDKKNHD
jgi:hypothetical protein